MPILYTPNNVVLYWINITSAFSNIHFITQDYNNICNWICQVIAGCFAIFYITYVRTVVPILEVVVHIKSLLFMQFSYELLILSYKHRLYLIPRHYTLGSTHFGTLVPTSLKRNSRWTLPFGLSCWLPIFKCLGFNLAPSIYFFLLS